MWTDHAKIAVGEVIFPKEQLAVFVFLYVNLATVQIWGQSIKFPLSCNSFKRLLKTKKFIRENSAKKNLLLPFNWVLNNLSNQGLESLLPLRTRESPETVFRNVLKAKR